MGCVPQGYENVENRDKQYFKKSQLNKSMENEGMDQHFDNKDHA